MNKPYTFCLLEIFRLFIFFQSNTAKLLSKVTAPISTVTKIVGGLSLLSTLINIDAVIHFLQSDGSEMIYYYNLNFSHN